MQHRFPSLPQVSAVRLLRPVLRLLLRAGFRFQEISEVVKVALVELAREEIQKASPKINPSRVSLLSGLHRKDVKRILKEGVVKDIPRGGVTAKILARWEQDPRFRNKSGSPRVLSFGAPDSEFSTLVRCESSDFNPGTVLFELERMESVRKTPRGLKLVEGLFSSPDDVHEGWAMLARDSELLIESVVQNLAEPEKLRNLHIRTEYDNILVREVPAIRRWLADEGRAFHKRIREFLSARDKDLTEGAENDEGGVYVALGSFSAIAVEGENKKFGSGVPKREE